MGEIRGNVGKHFHIWMWTRASRIYVPALYFFGPSSQARGTEKDSVPWYGSVGETYYMNGESIIRTI